MTMSLIQTVEVGIGGASTIEFTSIPQDGTELIILLSMRTTLVNNAYISVNSDRAANYIQGYWRAVNSTESAVTGTSGNNEFYLGPANYSSYTANTFTLHKIKISNYTSSYTKSILADNCSPDNATANMTLVSGGCLYTGTSPITSVQLGSTGIVQYSSASLYKVTKGSDGTTVVS